MCRQLVVAKYRFHGLSVEVRAKDSGISKRVVDTLDYIFARFIDEKGDGVDLAIDITTDQGYYVIASICPGLNYSPFELWSSARSIQSDSGDARRYRITGGSGFYGLLKSAYYAILSFVLANLGEFLQIHAGAVAKGETGIILPGGSGSGKTTLVLALARAGYGFMSDEICLIRPGDMTLLSFPRSIFLRKDVIDLFGGLRVGRCRGDVFAMREKKYLVEIDASSVCQGSVSVKVGPIIFPNYRPGSRIRFTEIAKADAMARLISSGNALNMLHQGIDQNEVIDMVSALIASAPCFELTSSDIDDAVQVIENFMGEFIS